MICLLVASRVTSLVQPSPPSSHFLALSNIRRVKRGCCYSPLNLLFIVFLILVSEESILTPSLNRNLASISDSFLSLTSYISNLSGSPSECIRNPTISDCLHHYTLVHVTTTPPEHRTSPLIGHPASESIIHIAAQSLILFLNVFICV